MSKVSTLPPSLPKLRIPAPKGNYGEPFSAAKDDRFASSDSGRRPSPRFIPMRHLLHCFPIAADGMIAMARKRTELSTIESIENEQTADC